MQAVDWGPACPQPSQYTGATKGIRDIDEDCLYLNIFSPNVSNNKILKLINILYSCSILMKKTVLCFRWSLVWQEDILLCSTFMVENLYMEQVTFSQRTY